MTLQRSFDYYQQAGQVGQIARPNAPYDIDMGKAGVALKPGDGVYYNAATDNFIKPVSAATRKLVTHVVSFNGNSINTVIPSPTTNNITEVVYAVGDIVPLVDFGTVYVRAGETLESEDAVTYSEATSKWIKYTGTLTTDIRKKAFYVASMPGKTVADGGIVAIKVPCRNYAFAGGLS